MVVPVEIPVETPAPVIEEALAGLLGFLGALLAPVRRALFAAVKWLVAQWWNDAVLPIWHTLTNLNVQAAADIGGLVHGLLDVNQRVSNVASQTVVTVQGVGAGAVRSLHDEIAGAENYAISISEDLYNRAVSRADAVGQEVLADAFQLYGSAVNYANSVVAGVRDEVVNLANGAYQHADAIAADFAETVIESLGAAVHYTDAAVLQLEGEIADTRDLAQALATAVGAATIARVLTAVKDLYDPCCEFTTDTVKPAWDKVKGMLGKLTRKGPLALVALGLASEAVVGLDKDAIVRGLVQARKSDHGTSLAALLEWGGLTVGGH